MASHRPVEIVAAGHVCLDVIPKFLGDQLPPPGALAEVGPVTVSTGGSVSNTGIALHRLGLGVRLVGRVGDDAFGREVRRLYDAAGEGLSAGLETAADAPTSYTVVVNPIGEDRRFLHCPGANATFRAAHVPDSCLLEERIELEELGRIRREWESFHACLRGFEFRRGRHESA